MSSTAPGGRRCWDGSPNRRMSPGSSPSSAPTTRGISRGRRSWWMADSPSNSMVDRRSFLTAAAAAAAGSQIQIADAAASPPIDLGDDPLGVRGDFPIVRHKTFLNSAYITPIPKQVVAAGQAFLQEKADHSFQLGPLLHQCEVV